MFEWGFRVEYVDTDAMGVAHHSNYFRWLERARVEWLRAIQMPYRELEAQGYGLPLRGARIQYLSPLRFDDEARVRVWVEAAGKAGLTLAYVLQCENRLVAEATTEHVLCKRGLKEGRVTWTPTRIPEEWRKAWLLPSAAKPSMSP